jgi:hypothetical protein
MMIRERVAEVQADKEVMKVVSEKLKKDIEAENKKKIEKVQEIKEGIQEARAKIIEDNIKNAAEMMIEYEAQKERAAKEAEEELARKAELIKQIRLLEKSIPSISKKIDLTETSGLGILGEMSILEV